ncbi:helix-turn-helix domain-containing protein [Chitinophaga sp. GCM10012297]|uniref:Helix-turn-helix transcriptional regulator n=1 Tax=Chitinophaga chungangae TaxID=2821488 RepID=A0ABS3YHK7_9BACT|nr:response regulator transcription factor [Chitinophaga chungangae]MBO9154171.1 helix-turn-helix transcriptional regulator [Chitinophaga chungangae]
MKLDVFSLLVLLGALQALVFGIYLLFVKTENRLQTRMLAFFILVLSYNGFETLNWSSELGKYLFVFDLFPFVLVFSIGPCVYLYVRSFRKEPPVKKPWKHFLIMLIPFTNRFLLVTGWLVWKFTPNHIKLFPPQLLDNHYGQIAEPASVLCSCTYYVFALLEFKRQRNENLLLPEEFRWLRILLAVMGLFNTLWLATYLYAYIFNVWGGEQYYVIEIFAVLFIYWIGFMGYHRTKIIYVAQQKKTQSYFDNLPKEEIDRCSAALRRAMEEERLYLRPDISTQSVADHIGASAKTLSAVLNQQVGKGFNEYVNGWRVEAVKQMMADPANAHLTITGMAFECGFNSQPTFQRAFKAATGQTPREFMQANSMQKQG